MADQERKIFFSYSRDDSKFALRLAEDMRAEGLDLWIDQLDIPSGAHWDQTVEDALKSSPEFLIVLSPNSIASQNVMDEVGFAIERKKRIIPVVHKRCEIPFRISRLQYIDFTGDYGTAFAKLLTALNTSPLNTGSRPSSIKPSAYWRFRDRKYLIALLAVAALGVFGGAFWSMREKTCADDSRYPLGRWTIEVSFETEGDYNRYVDLSTSKSGSWKNGTFDLSTKPIPNEDLELTYRTPNSNYTSTNLLRVSADGCTMSGQFSDKSKDVKADIHSGNVTYTWRNRPTAR